MTSAEGDEHGYDCVKCRLSEKGLKDRDYRMPTALREIRKAYEVLRATAFNRATDQARESFALPDQFFMASMNTAVLDKVQQWEGALQGWGWVRQGSNNRPKNFHVGLFNGHEVMGAAFGRVPKGKSHVRIDLLQRNPACEEAKGLITPLCVLAATHYAALIGAHRLHITNPINLHGVHRQYQQFGTYVPRGYSPFPGGHYVVNLE